jgi:hypothetical protein
MLYPNHHVIDIVDDAGPDPAALGGRGPAWPLRSGGLMLMQGERNRELGHKVVRTHLTTLKGGIYGFCVDRGASGMIRAMRETYRYQQRHGQPTADPELNSACYLMDAALVPLTHPMLTMSANERRAIQGPRVLIPE